MRHLVFSDCWILFQYVCSFLCDDAKQAVAIKSQLQQITRAMYGSPPVHGVLLVSTILGDQAIKALWTKELKVGIYIFGHAPLCPFAFLNCIMIRESFSRLWQTESTGCELSCVKVWKNWVLLSAGSISLVRLVFSKMGSSVFSNYKFFLDKSVSCIIFTDHWWPNARNSVSFFLATKKLLGFTTLWEAVAPNNYSLWYKRWSDERKSSMLIVWF